MAMGDRAMEMKTEPGIAPPSGTDHVHLVSEAHVPAKEKGGPLTEENCLFCRIARGEVPAEIVLSDDDIVAFRDIHPQAPTHVLLIPRMHIPSVNELSQESADVMGKLFLAARSLAESEGIARDGYRMVVNAGPGAGQTVFHLHLHLLGGRAMHWPPG